MKPSIEEAKVTRDELSRKIAIATGEVRKSLRGALKHANRVLKNAKKAPAIAAASAFGKLGGSATSLAKRAASVANGAKGGDGRKWYVVLSGEGTDGTPEAVYTTARGIKCRIARECAGGDRWCRAFQLDLSGSAADGLHVGWDSDGNARSWDREFLEGLGVIFPA